MPFETRDIIVSVEGDNWRIARLKQSLNYTDSETGDKYVVEAGFESDYGSIPRALWWWLPPHQYRPEYLLHDMFYRFGIIGRKRADEILRRSLREAGANAVRRNIIYAGVRAGGWVTFKKANR